MTAKWPVADAGNIVSPETVNHVVKGRDRPAHAREGNAAVGMSVDHGAGFSDPEINLRVHRPFRRRPEARFAAAFEIRQDDIPGPECFFRAAGWGNQHPRPVTHADVSG